jgi:thiol:disulfide interchange protein
MRWVNRVFAAMMFGMAAWYGWLAWTAWQARAESGQRQAEQTAGRFEATPATWPQAFAAAKATGKPVLVDEWATWCKNCLAMEKTTFANADVKKELASYAVVRLQAEDLAAFAALPEFKDLGIKGIPAFIIFE